MADRFCSRSGDILSYPCPVWDDAIPSSSIMTFKSRPSQKVSCIAGKPLMVYHSLSWYDTSLILQLQPNLIANKRAYHSWTRGSPTFHFGVIRFTWRDSLIPLCFYFRLEIVNPRFVLCCAVVNVNCHASLEFVLHLEIVNKKFATPKWWCLVLLPGFYLSARIPKYRRRLCEFHFHTCSARQNTFLRVSLSTTRSR